MRLIGALLGLDALWQVEVLLEAIVEIGALVALTWVAARALAGRPALAHAAWTLGLAAALALPIAGAFLPQRALLFPLPDALVHLDNRPDVGPLRAPLVAAVAPELAGPPAGPSRDAPGPGPLAWALLAWMAGAVAAGARLARAAWRVRRIVRSASPVADGEEVRAMARIAARIGARPARLLETDRVDVPMAAGALRPAIVLPRRRAWSAETRDLVLAHELAHVRRRDGIHHLLGGLAAVLYWFHPLVRLAARRQREEAERASDAVVLGTGVKASAYARGILDVVRGARRLETAALAVPFADPARLETRLRSILAPRAGRPHTLAIAVAFALLLAGAAGAALVRPAAAPGGEGKPCVEDAGPPGPPAPASFFAPIFFVPKCQSISIRRES